VSEELSAEDLARLDTLFERAADLSSTEQAAFVAEECGDNHALAGELERLLGGLAADDRLARIQPAAPTLAGTQVGPYRLIERIGEGGMGEVYVAEQLEPVQRRVAVKLIKPGLDSAEVVARFQAERQALARMRHPSVAQIHGGGTTESGRPYFVMEYVDGEPINAYCDRHRLSTRARLELFLDVCAGVQHAHQKGVVHRDLKPSNLLVTAGEDRPLPKVIDFGVARATSGRLADQTLMTQLGQVVGTLEYMSPEQADPGSVDVDTRSDVYSLGVVLYELVSGLMPFDRATLAGLSLSEVQKVLRETDPATPSTRLRRQMGTATSLAPLHGTEPGAWIRQLSGDLDWICLKALERDPARRYASVSELAEDVRRHLRHEPVLARRPSVGYRTAKFVRRNRLAVTAGAAVLVALGLGGALWLSGRLDALASERTARLLRPAGDMVRLDRLVQRADEDLWPAEPERIEAMQAWLTETDVLLAGLADHRLELEALRARALPWSTEDRQRDLESHPSYFELWRLRAAAERDALGGEPSEEFDQRLAEREERIEALEAALAPEAAIRRTWRFVSDDDLYWHGLLTDLVSGLEALTDEASGLRSDEGLSVEHGWSMPWRIRLAGDLPALSLEGEAAVLWEEAIRAIRESPHYGGLELTPQLGLVPIGPDAASGLWEFAHLLSGEPATRDNDGRIEMAPETGIVLVLLPGGSFRMGSVRRQDPFALVFKEGPVHEVEVAPFFISKFELTRAQWRRVTRSSDPDEPGFGPMHPAQNMNWEEANAAMRHMALVLPHEEQWEYATRAGTRTIWYTGNEELSLQGHANLYDQTGLRRSPGWAQEGGPASIIDDGSLIMTPVGTYRPNPFGLYDVAGNVGEWCGNAPYDYAGGGVPTEMSTTRSGRGGSARTNALMARSSARVAGSKNLAAPALGVRPARLIE
jgi:serine/threonine protein kinase/formylglycine-generating enzyme required for sulfatase activity